MKILVLCPLYPIPTDNGEKRRILAFLKYFSKNHDVTVLGMSSQPQKLFQTEQWIAEIVQWQDRKFWPVLKSIFSKHTYREIKFWNEELKIRIETMINQESFDVVWINFLNMVVYLEDSWDQISSNSFTVLDQHNVDTVFWKSFLMKSKNPLVRLLAYLEVKKAARNQRKWYSKFDAVASVSSQDLEVTKKFLQDKDSALWVVSNGVDSDFFKQKTDSSRQTEPVIAYSGSMDAYMNQEAVLWFHERIWPKIQEEVPGTQFLIIGRNPSSQIRKLEKEEGIQVTGTVPDIREYLNLADVFVIPLRLGGGTKLKTMEAVSSGIPIVSTPEGVQGLSVQDQKHVLVSSDQDSFAENVIKLLQNPDLRVELAKNARNQLIQEYNWQAIYAEVENKLTECIQHNE